MGGEAIALAASQLGTMGEAGMGALPSFIQPFVKASGPGKFIQGLNAMGESGKQKDLGGEGYGVPSAPPSIFNLLDTFISSQKPKR